MTPHFLMWSFGPKIGSVDRICHQTDSMNRFYLDVKTGPYQVFYFSEKYVRELGNFLDLARTKTRVF